MTTPKRYIVLGPGWEGVRYEEGGEMREAPDGEWVRYDDIKHLLQDEPRAELANPFAGTAAMDTSASWAHKPGCAVLSAAGNPACSCGALNRGADRG